MAFVSVPNAETKARYDAFSDALHVRGLEVSPPLDGRPGASAVTPELVVELMDRGSLPDCFVCANDEEALVVMETLRAAVFSVPGQVAVAGFDGVVAGRLVRPSLTTVRQPMELMGRTAVELLVDAIARPLAAPASRELPVRLVSAKVAAAARTDPSLAIPAS
ncbi:DNA-binding LacI/PurR family transcriptional regulator [Arthrobacter sp. 1088]|uniref:substrate-binding domain-containing protein n=1 Tax=Arthrobacter sp. 1088 TaxID=2817768 RepID=UPI00285D08CD|nr:substrate-binding domain-containing protein [Arthrobacter sp. 1088]MDR6688310.1 DNA-binding LacI/PurR family transcriptional regulator [Arthrobacter sp. 1088]